MPVGGRFSAYMARPFQFRHPCFELAQTSFAAAVPPNCSYNAFARAPGDEERRLSCMVLTKTREVATLADLRLAAPGAQPAGAEGSAAAAAAAECNGGGGGSGGLTLMDGIWNLVLDLNQQLAAQHQPPPPPGPATTT